MDGEIELEKQLAPTQICHWIISLGSFIDQDDKDSKARFRLEFVDDLSTVGETYVYLYKQSTSMYVPRYEKIVYSSTSIGTSEISLEIRQYSSVGVTYIGRNLVPAASRVHIYWEVEEGDMSEDESTLETTLILAIVIVSIGACLICIMLCACRYKSSVMHELQRIHAYEINAEQPYN